jgi:hypothetical protein
LNDRKGLAIKESETFVCDDESGWSEAEEREREAGKQCFQKQQDPERFVQPIRVERLRIS